MADFTYPEAEVSHLKLDLAEIKESIKALQDSLRRLPVMEDRFASIIKAQDEIRSHIDNLDERLRKLENEYIYAKASAKTLAFTAKIAWALGGGVCMAIASRVLQAFS
jgi:uncharacterized protein YPO0396